MLIIFKLTFNCDHLLVPQYDFHYINSQLFKGLKQLHSAAEIRWATWCFS